MGHVIYVIFNAQFLGIFLINRHNYFKISSYNDSPIIIIEAQVNEKSVP
jgi:hypothetical protein